MKQTLNAREGTQVRLERKANLLAMLKEQLTFPACSGVSAPSARSEANIPQINRYEVNMV